MHTLTQRTPVSGWLIQETADFPGEIKKMRDIANGILKTGLPAEIPIAQADRMISTTTRAAQEFQKKANVIINDPGSAFVRSQLKSSAASVQWDWERKIRDRLMPRVAQAKSQGKATVTNGSYQNSFTFNIATMLFNIVGGYEALEEVDSYKPVWLRMAPSYMVGLMATVGFAVANAAQYVADLLNNALDAAGKGSQMLIDILKWGSIAGGLYLLYKTLDPNQGKK
jgi:hypothetical protein